MTEALVPLNGSPVRVIQSEIGPVVPVVDIADMIGYTSDHLTKKIRENPDVFKDRQVLTDLPTAGGMQKCTCLDRVGFDRLLLLLKPAKTRDVFEKIEAFRLKAFGQLAEHKEIVPVQQQPSGIIGELQEARELAALCGKSPELFQAAVLKKHGKTELALRDDMEEEPRGFLG
jgi:hypothetical protein